MPNPFKDLPITHPAPKGYISIRDAWIWTVAVLHPKEWSVNYDEKTDEVSKTQYRAVADKLTNALQEGRLQGVTDSSERRPIPAIYWPSKAHVTSGQLIEDGTIIIVEKDRFLVWLKSEFHVSVPRPGPKSGSGKIDDTKAFEAMRSLIDIEGYSVHAAAVEVEPDAGRRGGCPASVISRLERKYPHSN
jgi:hypothetical protein